MTTHHYVVLAPKTVQLPALPFAAGGRSIMCRASWKAFHGPLAVRAKLTRGTYWRATTPWQGPTQIIDCTGHEPELRRYELRQALLSVACMAAILTVLFLAAR